jgi:hypothetical protein
MQWFPQFLRPPFPGVRPNGNFTPNPLRPPFVPGSSRDASPVPFGPNPNGDVATITPNARFWNVDLNNLEYVQNSGNTIVGRGQGVNYYLDNGINNTMHLSGGVRGDVLGRNNLLTTRNYDTLFENGMDNIIGARNTRYVHAQGQGTRFDVNNSTRSSNHLVLMGRGQGGYGNNLDHAYVGGSDTQPILLTNVNNTTIAGQRGNVSVWGTLN